MDMNDFSMISKMVCDTTGNNDYSNDEIIALLCHNRHYIL